MNQSNYSERLSKIEMKQALSDWNGRVKDAKIKRLEAESKAGKKKAAKQKDRIFELEFEMAEIMVMVQELKTGKTVSDTQSILKKMFGGKK